MESGIRAVDSMELVQIARAVQKPISFFLDLPLDQVQDEPMTVLFRSERITEDDRPAVEDFISISKDYAALEDLMELSDPSLLPPRISSVRTKWEAVVQGEKAATNMRNYLNMGEAPSLDLENVLGQRGVKIIMRPLPQSGVWGFSVTSREFGHAIFVNTCCTREKQLFTLAHELGHLTMDRDHSATVFTKHEATEDKKQQTKSLSEVRANSFAAAFLIPASSVHESLLKLGFTKAKTSKMSAATVEFLRKRFGVSYDAMLWRLVNMQVITKSDREKLLPFMTQDTAPTVDETASLLPERYRALALEAYRRAKISIGKLADLLRVDIYEARKLVKQFGIQQSPA